MSGHSKWANIHKQKEVADAKRGAVFTKLARNITLAAREKGGDPEMNSSLRAAIEKAKEVNMPKDNIERAIKKGTGELEGMKIEEVTYEGFGPEGTALIIKCITDNKNRTAANVRHILTKAGGRLGEPNSVMWMFEQKGVIRIKNEELRNQNIMEDELELEVIDQGAEDIKSDGEEKVIYTNIKDLFAVKEFLSKKGLPVAYAETEWIAKNETEMKNEEAKNKVIDLMETLDEDEDIQDFYINVNL